MPSNKLTLAQLDKAANRLVKKQKAAGNPITQREAFLQIQGAHEKRMARRKK